MRLKTSNRGMWRQFLELTISIISMKDNSAWDGLRESRLYPFLYQNSRINVLNTDGWLRVGLWLLKKLLLNRYLVKSSIHVLETLLVYKSMFSIRTYFSGYDMRSVKQRLEFYLVLPLMWILSPSKIWKTQT